jgi:hypothetical protein
LQSVLRRQRVVIKGIKTVWLAKQDNDERGDDALGVRVKFSVSMLRLCRFAERDEFLNALNAANPVIVVKFD